MGDKRLHMMVGLPRSGKSTKARKMGFPIVNPDSIRLAIHGQSYVQMAEPFVWATAHAMVRALFLAGHTNVTLDVCNNTKKRRDEWKDMAWKRVYHVVDTSAEECLDRVLNDENLEAEDADRLVKTIDRMVLQHEPIGPEEQDE